MPPEIAEVRAWLTKAQHGWLAAIRLFTPDCAMLDIVGFHCEQAVEKTLKAYLVSREVEFEKPHDLVWLLDLCSDCDRAFESLRQPIKPLSAYAVASLYPGPAEPTRSQVEHALAVVEQVWDLVAQRVPTEAVPDKPAR